MLTGAAIRKGYQCMQAARALYLCTFKNKYFFDNLLVWECSIELGLTRVRCNGERLRLMLERNKEATR